MHIYRMSHVSATSQSKKSAEAQVDDAVRVLARLLARQAAAELRTSHGDGDGPDDEEVADHGEA